MKYKIYYIENKVNKKLYVGYTSKDINKRFEKHIQNAKKKINRKLYDSMNFHGYNNFEIKFLDECDTIEKAHELESWYIYILDSKNPNKGYNMTWGGDGGYTLSNWSEENKKKLYERQKISREKTFLSKYGVKSATQIDSVKKKISDSHKGLKHTEKTKKKISNTFKRKIKNGEIIVNSSGLRPHKIGEFKHTEETKKKLSKARKGKTYDELFDAEKAEKLRLLHKEQWSGETNPNFVENVTDKEFCFVIKEIINNKTIEEISKLINKSPYKIRQRFKKENINNIQKLKRSDKNNEILTKLINKYEK